MEKNGFKLEIYCMDNITKEKLPAIIRFFDVYLNRKINRTYDSPNINMYLFLTNDGKYFGKIKNFTPQELVNLFNNIGSVSFFPTYELFLDLTDLKIRDYISEDLYYILLYKALINLTGNCLINSESRPVLTLDEHVKNFNQEIETLLLNRVIPTEEEDIVKKFVDYDKSSSITHYGYSDKIERFKEPYVKFLISLYNAGHKTLSEINDEYLLYYGEDMEEIKNRYTN